VGDGVDSEIPQPYEGANNQALRVREADRR